MDDAFTLLRQAVDLLPEDAVAENGQTAGDARKEIELQEWEMALDVLIEIADIHPVSITFWKMLSEAARQMMLDRSRRWCEWRGWEAEHGTIRATLSLLGPTRADARVPSQGTVGSGLCGASVTAPQTDDKI
ncbi:hypothetical protein [Streptomyces blastmyceticus]|uniref:Tetratricopeptide repeat protein n=1 Tax=Streptomyces blastmyceticus TaxID=68180 RepID=A0ABN0WSA6_9ACTN